jgi:tripartite-type tricarboxylate transporter receptor subunit TctC
MRNDTIKWLWVPAFAGTTVLAAMGLLPSSQAQAQSVEEFYKGKTINVLIGVGVGGEYDLQARLVARHIGKHIPGHPTVVAQNMTGAGGMKMANYLFNQAPRDGTYIGMLGNNFAATQAVGGAGVHFDVVKFNWLGTIAPVVETMAVLTSTGVKTVDDLRKKEIVAGATGKGAITSIYPSMMNEFLGTKFKVVTGYPGGNQINLAMERAEVQARNNTWSSWKATRPVWLRDKFITIIVQAGPRAPDLDAPSVETLAKTADDRKLIELVTSGTHLGRPMATTPGVPAERVKALRDAYRATMADPAFRAEAAKANFEVAPVYGEEMQQTVGKIMSTPKELASRAKHLVQ